MKRFLLIKHFLTIVDLDLLRAFIVIKLVV